MVRPFGWPEAVVAAPAALLVIATGAISWDHAGAEAGHLGPVIGFLAAVLVLAKFCDDEGLFHACGAWMARWAAGQPGRLLTAVFALASAITAVLSLDATIVLLTPVVFATAARMGARPKPHVYACTHLSNTASLLLPVSNLTNLLAFTASGLSFTRFAALMVLPWLVAIGAEYVVFRRFFAGDLAAAVPEPTTGEPPELPLFALVTVGCTLAGFVVASALGVDPAWSAAAGALVLAVRALLRGRATPLTVLRAAAPAFLVFVLALGIVVRAVVDNGLSDALGHLLRTAAGCPRCSGSRRSPPYWPISSTTCPPSWCCCRWPPRPDPARCWPCSWGSTSAPTSPTPDPWRPCCGGVSCRSTTTASICGSSPGWV